MMKTVSHSTGGSPVVKNVSIDEGHAEQRLDNFLLSQLKGVPKTLIYRIIRKGEVRVNKKRAKAGLKLTGGDIVRIPPVRVAAEKEKPVPGVQFSRLLEASVLFEDDVLLVLNKPSGIAVHGGSGVRLGVIESFRQMRPDCRFMELVHRIDKDTSGCLLIAKKRSMLRYLHEEIREGRMHKVYQSLVAGRWPSRKKVVTAPLLKNVLRSGERIVTVSEEGKASRTWFDVLETFSGSTLVQATLDTGRTHQIRVHARSVGHPILGDPKYGDEALNKVMKRQGVDRLMLHAWHLGLTLPDGKKVKFTASLPSDFSEGLRVLRELNV